jgi:glycosyltransferase involved in cell wall biosynthesis
MVANTHVSPLVSILLPVFNGDRFIDRCIHSALACGVDDIEILVQDGGSTDETLQIVAEVGDARIHVESRPDRGQADALNQALARARGKWILWLNADDEVARGAVGRALALRQADAEALVGDHAHIDEAGIVVKRYRVGRLTADELLRRGTYVFSGSLLVPATRAREIGFDPGLEYCMDFDFMLRLAGRNRIDQVAVEIGRFRLQPESKTEVSPWRTYREHFSVARRAGAYKLDRLPWTVRLHLEMAAYILTRPLWRSSWWRRIRPTKTIRFTGDSAGSAGS